MVADFVYACALVFWSNLKTRNSVARDKHQGVTGKPLPDKERPLILMNSTPVTVENLIVIPLRNPLLATLWL
jgi:hypothetical protein